MRFLFVSLGKLWVLKRFVLVWALCLLSVSFALPVECDSFEVLHENFAFLKFDFYVHRLAWLA